MDKITNFSSHFNSIVNKKSRTELRNNIISVTGVTYACFRKWLLGIHRVPKVYRAAIAEIMGVPVETLFPDTAN